MCSVQLTGGLKLNHCHFILHLSILLHLISILSQFSFNRAQLMDDAFSLGWSGWQTKLITLLI